MKLGALCLLFLAHIIYGTTYEPNWASLDKRPIPTWFDEAKFGIFNHWGLYSTHGMPCYFWEKMLGGGIYAKYLKDNYRPDFTYADFGPQFHAEFFDAKWFADLIKRSGAKYYVVTSKHHEGFTMWPSKYAWNFNSYDVGPNRDFMGELRDAFRNHTDIHFGMYFSHFEFYNPLYLRDAKGKYKSNEYVRLVSQPQLQEIVHEYKPDLIWGDGQWMAPSSYWNSTNFLAWLYNESELKDFVVVNDRWGQETECKHGGYYTCMDRYDPGFLQNHKWESPSTTYMPTVQTGGNTWAYSSWMRAENVMTVKNIVSLLARTVSTGGNLLLNVGPTGYGRIQPIFEERLTKVGDWLAINGEAIYATKPWIYQNDSFSGFVWYTSKMRSNFNLDAQRLFNPQIQNSTVVYGVITKWPTAGVLKLGDVNLTPKSTVSMLGYSGQIPIKTYMGTVHLDLYTIPWQNLPTLHNWVLKFEYLQTEDRNPIEILEKQGVYKRQMYDLAKNRKLSNGF